MAIFDFVKDAGMAVGQQMELGKVVHDLGIKIEKPEVLLKDHAAIVKGKVRTQAEREKIILALGNVKGVASVEDHLEVEVKEPAEAAAVFYTVKAGDSLSKIAKAHYGDPKKYTAIFEANKPMLSDPDKIFPGQSLRIPKI